MVSVLQDRLDLVGRSGSDGALVGDLPPYGADWSSNVATSVEIT